MNFRIGSLVLFSKSGQLCRVVSRDDEGNYTIARVDNGKQLFATHVGVEAFVKECGLCDKRVRTGWMVILKNGPGVGFYCSKSCANSDSWGPIYRGSFPRKITAIGVELGKMKKPLHHSVGAQR